MKLEEIKGIGERTLNTLGRLGINNTNDLITYYPFRYNVLKRSELDSLNDQDKIVIDGHIDSVTKVTYLKNHRDKLEFTINTGNKLINVVLFNRGFIKSKLEPGSNVTVIGKFEKRKNLIIASDVKFDLLNNIPKIEPIYHVTTGINSVQLNNIIKKVLFEGYDYVPNYLNEKYNLLSKENSIKEIHFPSNSDKLRTAISKLKYEELFIFMLKMQYLKVQKNNFGISRKISFSIIEDKMKELPFDLTLDQITSIKEIYNDLISSKRMNRLLQGDVGSGKTIVAFLALYINHLGGFQGALMAPTEILARQHFINIQALFPELKVVLLTGKIKVKEKRIIYDKVLNGEVNVIIGTHALISDDFKYSNLGLVITDEQHRFGVNQRSNLKNKGNIPDILYMSATPIPRTYAITLYGDMDISSIKTKPQGRKEIITILKNNREIKDVLTLMYEELKKKHQIYIVAPLIEESEKISLENINKLKEKITSSFGKLCNIGIMHGKLANKDKEDVMTKFKNNDIQILISTTVIEVGVDVSNATVMVVFDSDRFGLSALHQLRGRVGRNNLQSYFIMISDSNATRLDVLVKNSDGFDISEADFKLRGSGDLFGLKQSGDMTFKLAEIKRDFKMVVKAKEDSEYFYNQYFDKEEYKYIKDSIINLNTLD